MKRILFCLLLATIGNTAAFSQEHENHHDNESPHHLSVFLGGSDLEDEAAFTIGVDYEYRLSQFLGLGSVLEYATDNIDATTLLFVADLHIWRGLVIQTGPGVEFIDNETSIVGRIGGLYEFEIGESTISPQIHLDVTEEESTLVFGLAFGMNF